MKLNLPAFSLIRVGELVSPVVAIGIVLVTPLSDTIVNRFLGTFGPSLGPRTGEVTADVGIF